MGVVVPFKCEKCTFSGTAEIGLELRGYLNIGPNAKFIVGQCIGELCDGRLLVASGLYKNHENLMVYKGPYAEGMALENIRKEFPLVDIKRSSWIKKILDFVGRPLRWWSALIILFFFLLTSAPAETFIELKDGGLYGGSIVAESDSSVTLKVMAEYMTFERSEIKRIYEKANTPDDQWHERTKKAKENDNKKEKPGNQQNSPKPKGEMPKVLC
jgi:hypothetical protein